MLAKLVLILLLAIYNTACFILLSMYGEKSYFNGITSLVKMLIILLLLWWGGFWTLANLYPKLILVLLITVKITVNMIRHKEENEYKCYSGVFVQTAILSLLLWWGGFWTF